MPVYLHEMPSLAALLLKFVLFYYASRSPVRNSLTRLYLALLALMFVFNLIECFGISYYNEHGIGAGVMKYGFTHFAALIPAIAVLTHISLRLSFNSSDTPPSRNYFLMLYLPVIPLEYLLLGTNELIQGFVPFQYSIRRDPGPLYYLFETYMVVYLTAAIVNLLYGARSSRKPVVARVRSQIWLLGLTPMALMLVYLMLADYLKLPAFTSTFYLPIASTIFLFATAYATYQYRLFDIEFYIPWSKARKRKTAFHQRIQAMIDGIAQMRSVDDIVNQLAEVLHCPVALIAGARPLAMSSAAAGTVLRFPAAELKQIDNIVVAREISEAAPSLHALMQQHHVAAIVPFYPRSQATASWMLLGDAFHDNVYTPIDFKLVESLLGYLADRFLDDQLLLRSRLEEAAQRHDGLQQRLAMAWGQVTALQTELAVLREDNTQLRKDKIQLLRKQIILVPPETKEAPDPEAGPTLDDYMAEYEAWVVTSMIKHCQGDRDEVASRLGIRLSALLSKIERYGIDEDDTEAEKD